MNPEDRGQGNGWKITFMQSLIAMNMGQIGYYGRMAVTAGTNARVG